ncbi:hypothetical protein [Yoonia sp. 2307UL14-13]|uniref:hypothetical protein n=1 Tax=Yoonia sp. 2307UL14-13 TaxID=3126506 RepID=UPI00309A3424
MAVKTISRPELTLPEGEAAWITDAYHKADVILEYGSGGSTVLASEMPGKTVFSVESDSAWSDNLQAYLDQTKPASMPVLHPVNIGPVGKWGRPVDDSRWRNYHSYPLSVWDRADFVQPDVVLIDGRFRAACFLTAVFRTQKPITIYFDDYVGRRRYHVAEDYGGAPDICGRMARFEVEPQAIDPMQLSRMMSVFTVPF